MPDIDTEIAEIEAVQRDDNVAYWKSGMPARYGELLEARENGMPAPAGPSARAQRIAEIEKLMAEPANSSEYWHSEKLQTEYLALIDGKSSTPKNLPAGELAEHLGISEAQASDMQGRVDSAFEGLDTTEMDSAFEGLSDETQAQALRLLADPSILADTASQDRFIMGMSDEAWEELLHFEANMTTEEHGALKRALLVS